jgi:alkanesulfonate monooxygenase SsuD/methylene tetrahydromethanopterin reductase-like flavin-dependent oxidoreductase (luciferase family)
MVAGRSDALVLSAGLQAWVGALVNMPHFLASYRMVYRTRESIRAHPWAAIYVPILLVLACVGSVIAARWTDVPVQFDRVRAACEEVGRDPNTLTLSAAITVCCGKDEAEVERRAGSLGRSVDELRANALCGTPSELIDRIGQYKQTGAQRLYLQVMDLEDLDHIRLVGTEVLPRV